MADSTQYARYSGLSGGSSSGVTSLDLLTGALTLSPGTGISITDNGVNTITIGSTSAGDVTIGAFGSTPNANGLSISGSQVLNLQPADTTHPGGLTAADWNTFNNKQAAGNYITALTGDGVASGPEVAVLTLATVNSNTGSFGSSTAIPSLTVNGKGLITAASTNVVIAPAGTLTGTTLASNVVTSSLTTVGTIGTGIWNGTAIDIAHGGTGQTTKAPAFNALSPLTTAGDMLYGGTSGAGTRLAAGLAGAWLIQGASSTPAWSSTTTTGKFISGSADEKQLTVDGFSTQTNDILAVRKSDATLLLGISNTAGAKIFGTTTNNDAVAGYVGEYIQSVVAAVSFPSTGTWGDLASISLTAGDWDVNGMLATSRNGATVTSCDIGISTTTGNSTTGLVYGSNRFEFPSPLAGNYDTSGYVPAFRISLATTTTVYLKFSAAFSIATPQASGRLSARRIR